ncbi:hypothetical protein [Candidatus Nitronereus thalassa]|uniref:Uncharacterized protein n=1 Tax=Candidatus Nitronereus thalassa TaxID=3020898 RepID=A0ABU3KB38_9BACT|nr:hypothetical protein [Candidatus Nitronereus thalassa]MDT7043621.1 hypothetical protein [Candidatus Nitronereus thalassa]
MESTQKYNVEKLKNFASSDLPNWIKRVLNTEEDGTFEGEHNAETSEVSFQVARWNLLVTRELIRQGLWTPTSKNLETLHKLNLKYNISPLS